MANFSHTQKLFAGALVVTFSVVGVYGYVVFDIFKKNQQTRELEAVVHTSAIQKNVERSTRTTLSTTQESRALLEALFLQEDEIVDFIEHVESFSRLTGASLDIRKIDTVEAAEQQDVYEWLEFSIVAEGSWQEVYHALALFENLPIAFVLDVANLRVRGEGDTASWSGRFDFRVAKKKTL